MLRRIGLTIVLSFALSLSLAAQRSDLAAFNRQRLDINRKAMLSLGTWAGANILAGTIQYTRSRGDERYFHQMNIAWNAVNLALAGYGYYRARGNPGDLSLTETLKAQTNLEKLLLFNAGLDVAYIMTGVFLIERAGGASRQEDRLRGYGNSLILQGGFLFAFDLVVYFYHLRNHRKLTGILEKITVGSGKIGLRFSF